ncbi:MAG: hypothetical protein IJI04_00805 [Lachnospiraceae bacterium]|nr:hypothetical protein [Lachnospiraceae bacterium]
MKEDSFRSVEGIMQEIRSRAAAYTPEWHLDTENPDIGTALAIVYAGIQSGLDRKFQLLTEKLKIDYFNCLNVSMKTSEVAEGYAVFELNGDDADGEILQAGAMLRCDVTDEQGENVPVELSEDICVVPDTLEAIYETNGRKDYIGLLYDRESETFDPFPLYGMSAENQERHVFYLSHPWMFRFSNYGNIIIRFLDEEGHVLPEDQITRFEDTTAVRFFYEAGDGSRQILPDIKVKDGSIRVRKPSGMSPWEEREHGGIESFWIGCEILDTRGLESFAPFMVLLGAECPAVRPDCIYSVGSEQSLEEPIFAFGENFSLFDEIYFGSGDVLSKRGAEIELSFEEEFAKIPIESDIESAFNWKLIMPKDQFRQEKDYDITVEEVIWEYFNGIGWSRLFPGSAYRDIFSPVHGMTRQLKKIRFICPPDLEPAMAGSGINYYIRARILKVNNAFRTRGQYLSPVISDVCFSCRLDAVSEEPVYFHTLNHLEEKNGSLKSERQAGNRLSLIEAGDDPQPAMYIGFRRPPMQGPVRVLWETGQILEKAHSTVAWEYYKNEGWSSLHAADATESFRKTGTVTFSGIPDAARKNLFGRNLYWIRAVRGVREENYREVPEIRAWYLNAAHVETIRHGLTEYLTMENYSEGAQFQLLNGNIHELELWVREDDRLHPIEIEELKADGRYREVQDANGLRTGAWIRWICTDNLRRHKPYERVYMLDENQGVITFGGGTCGRLPAPGVIDGIHVLYSVGGGKAGCLPKNSINGLDLSGGHISSVTNPMPLYGAYDRETAQKATKRAAAEFRTGMRAVSERDFEELALGFMGNLRKAHCYSGIDHIGRKMPGAVTLALLANDYMDRGAGFETIRRRLYDWFEGKISASLKCGGNFRIREAELVRISLQIEATIADYQKLYTIQKALEDSLEEFLNPIHGELTRSGWEIGSLPDRIQIETLIRSVEGIRGLRRCVILANLLKQPGSPAVDFDEIRAANFVVPVNGTHRIRLILDD